tara:strand:+ start:576 stop:743 length:168 start_codon:yes stop_codon:yes gene_type:complete
MFKRKKKAKKAIKIEQGPVLGVSKCECGCGLLSTIISPKGGAFNNLACQSNTESV